ncbi:tetratricopeptide repeat protein [Anaeramoeba flamelloides]|uniref:Tetratricopeptide repeat protein n=1 Tax=Anaeramoeba flamelloides TaxID=1746091 RepID=A0AAV7ZLM9_9EUKA|nr:tetratricopeptide repeat protein [Anaeramoeba flamelloides]
MGNQILKYLKENKEIQKTIEGYLTQLGLKDDLIKNCKDKNVVECYQSFVGGRFLESFKFLCQGIGLNEGQGEELKVLLVTFLQSANELALLILGKVVKDVNFLLLSIKTFLNLLSKGNILEAIRYILTIFSIDYAKLINLTNLFLQFQSSKIENKKDKKKVKDEEKKETQQKQFQQQIIFELMSIFKIDFTLQRIQILQMISEPLMNGQIFSKEIKEHILYCFQISEEEYENIKTHYVKLQLKLQEHKLIKLSKEYLKTHYGIVFNLNLKQNFWKFLNAFKPTKNENLWLSLGKLSLKQGNEDQAFDCFQKAFQICPTNPEIIDKLALVQFKFGETGLANENFTKAIKLSPDNAFYWNHRGLSFIKMRKPKKADLDFEKALQLSNEKNQNKLLKERTQLRWGRSEWKSVIKLAKMMNKNDPEDSWAWNIRGKVALLKRKFDQALPLFENAAKFLNVKQMEKKKKNIQNTEFKYFEINANMSLSRNNLQQAIWEYSELLFRQKSFGANKILIDSYIFRGMAYEKFHLLEKASEDFSSAIKLNPDCLLAGKCKRRVTDKRDQKDSEQQMDESSDSSESDSENDVLNF